MLLVLAWTKAEPFLFSGKDTISVLKQMFRFIDLDNSGSVSKKDMNNLIQLLNAFGFKNNLYPDGLIEQMDVNKDEMVSIDEWVTAVTRNTDFS